MKRFKGTWIFALVVIALGVYVFWDFTEQKKKDDLQEGEVRLTQFSPSDVTRLNLKKDDTLIQIERADHQCRITHPVKDRCEVMAVENLLAALSPLRGRPVLKASELKKDSDDYGLQSESAVEISWELKKGSGSEIKIGTKNSFDGGFYILKDGTVYVVDRAIGQASNKGLKELRSKTVLPEVKDIREISIGSVTLKKEGENWKFAEKSPYPADSSKVDDWVSSLKRLKATNVSDEEPKLPSKPKWKISVKAKEGSHSIDFFEKTKNLYVAKESSQEKFFEIPSSRLDDLLVKKVFFYNGKAPFDFPLERVAKVRITVDGKKLEFQKKDKKWVALGDHPPFKESELTAFFQKLSQLEAKSFEAPKKSHFSSKNEIELFDSSKKTLFGLQWGDQFGKESLQAVRVIGKPDTFGVSQTSLKELLAVDFFSKPSATKEPTSEKHR